MQRDSNRGKTDTQKLVADSWTEILESQSQQKDIFKTSKEKKTYIFKCVEHIKIRKENKSDLKSNRSWDNSSFENQQEKLNS